MPRKLTPEELEARKASLARGRATAAANRAKRAAEPAPEAEAPLEPVGGFREPDEPVPLELDDAEWARIREEAKKKVDAELDASRKLERRALIEKALDEETKRQRRAAGLANHLDDLVEILIDVAPFAADIRIDDKIYQHGQWYTVDRRKADTLREIMARGWDAEERAGNPNRKFRREVAGSMNPMAHERRLADGTLTVGLDTRVHGRTGAAAGLPSVGA